VILGVLLVGPYLFIGALALLWIRAIRKRRSARARRRALRWHPSWCR
jgi:hypothetical protein